MVAAVEKMFSVRETPWHRLGSVLENSPSLSEAIKLAGLDWEVGLKKLFTEDGVPVKHWATYRKSDNSILGVVGPRYTPLQNADAFNWFEPFIKSKEVTLTTAGSLNSGQVVWMLAQIKRANEEIIKGDSITKFLLLSNSHDGKLSVRVGFTPIRVVCANTLSMAHSAKDSKLIRLRHSRQVKENLDSVRETIDVINQQFEMTAEQYRYLASRHINSSDLRKYVKVVLGFENIKDVDMKTRSKNQVEKILQLCEAGRGTDINGVRGTWWGAMNAVTEYYNFEYGRTQNNRLSNLWFGNKDKFALDKALEMAV